MSTKETSVDRKPFIFYVGDKDEQIDVASLIEDGSITTDKLADNAITNDKIASNAVTVSKIAPGSVNATQIADDAITPNKLSSMVLEMFDEKADLDGYYPDMTAGEMAGTTEEHTYLTRAVGAIGGTGAEIEAVYGNTVVFNQLNKLNPVISDTATGITKTINSNGSVTVDGTCTADGFVYIDSNMRVEQGHKYLIKGCPSGGSSSTYSLGISGASTDTGNGGIQTWSSSSSNYGSIRLLVKSGVSFDNVTFWPIVCDLTRMFGAGNEPSTVAEFEAMFPNAYYAYNTGSLLNVNMQGIETEDADGNPLDSLEIPVSTYFPTGMKGVGTAHDALYADHAETVMGAIELGSLTWTANSTSQSNVYRMIATLSDAKRATASNAKANMICAKYETITQDQTWTTDVTGVAIGANDSILRIYDPNYNTSTSAQAFTAALDGVYLYYELASPTTTTINPPLNLAYQVESGGTESIIVDTTQPSPQSAPPTMAVVYALNSQGIVDKALSVIAAIENGKASTNYAIGSYLIHNGGLYRVTSAIATGETIAPGTNCTKTTVMSEVVTLTS